jgi:hypothetical protein
MDMLPFFSHSGGGGGGGGAGRLLDSTAFELPSVRPKFSSGLSKFLNARKNNPIERARVCRDDRCCHLLSRQFFLS